MSAISDLIDKIKDPDLRARISEEVARILSEKTVTEEGWQHTKVVLKPLNPAYDVIELDDEQEYKTVGLLKCVINNERC